MKKILAVILSLVLVLSLAACGAKSVEKESQAEGESESAAPASGLKVGFIFLHDENSTYDKNFIEAAKEACANLGAEPVIKTNIPEDKECYETAADLADSGCSIVFADSFGHEDYMIQAAQEYPDVQFCHATGTQAHTAGLDNFHNCFASIYEGRYLAGIAAGLKLNEMIDEGKIKPEEAKIGYIGAYTYAEVISGYTSFFLGARSICESATMSVQFTGSWYDETMEKEAATKLIESGCVLISQHADSMGSPTACENAGVPNVSYNGSTKSVAPNTFIISSKINWVPYMEYIITQVQNGEAIDTDWTGTIATGSVQLTEINEDVAAEGTKEAIIEAQAKLEDGSLKVFDTSTFTVDGKTLETYLADVDTDPAYTPDTEAVADGYFHESEYRSAPYFDIQIDGIELLNAEY